MPKVVIVNTSASELKGHPTGVWLEEAACPYYLFKEAGFEVVLASTAGGPVPIDQGSVSGDFFTDACKKFLHDPDAIGALSHSVKLSDVDLSTVDCLYMSGGHGTAVDFFDNATLKAAIETVYNAGKVVAADCHGPICLAQCNKADGTPLVAGLECTGFTNSEEAAVQLTEKVPFLIETKFEELGGKFSKGEDWGSNVTTAGNLICGQNPASSEACAKACIDFLKK